MEGSRCGLGCALHAVPHRAVLHSVLCCASGLSGPAVALCMLCSIFLVCVVVCCGPVVLCCSCCVAVRVVHAISCCACCALTLPWCPAGLHCIVLTDVRLHVQGMVLGDRPGRIRGLQWTNAAVSAIYLDKSVQVSASMAIGIPDCACYSSFWSCPSD